MRLGPSARSLLLLGTAAFALVYSLAADWQRRLVVMPVSGDVLYAQDSDDDAGGQGKTFQRLRKTPQAATAEYGFVNFNRDALTIKFQMPRGAYERYVSDWGYRESDLADLSKWHDAARAAAYKTATAKHESQAQFNADLASLKAQYDQKVKDYIASKCFRFVNGNELEVDIPKVVSVNAPLVKPLAAAFDQIAVQRRYDSGNIIGAVSSLVQTAVVYKVPPSVINGVHNGGFWPPLQTILGGWGDCDTKTGTLASILRNWAQMRMVGLALPEHYLLAILRIPNKGDLFIEYQGLQYVVVEPAGPAWLAPGTVAEHTQNLLEASQGYRIEPFF